MKKLIYSLMLALPVVLNAQKEIPLSSTIQKVTVFFQGAQMDHYRSVELQPGRQEVVFQKLTDFVDPNTVQVKAKGSLTIISVKTRKNFEDMKITNEEVNALNDQKKKLEKRDLNLRDEYEILLFDKDLILKNRELKGTDLGLKVSELKEAYAFMHEKLNAITIRQSAIKEELEGLNKDMNRIEQEIVSRRNKPVTNYTEIIVEIDVDKQTKGEFFFSYITPRASWKPYYDMRSNGIGDPVRLEAKALVTQSTGISWDNVDLVLSTNDPYENSAEPILNPWYLNYNNYPQQRTVASRQLPTVDYSGQLLKGIVFDASTGEPMPFAQIRFPSNPNIGTVTDADGKFEVNVPRGEYYATASYVGYQPMQLQITAPYLKFFLKADQLELNEVVVSDKNQVASSAYRFSGVESMDGVILEKRSRNRKDKYRNDMSANGNSVELSVGQSSSYTWSQQAQSTVVQKDLRMEYAIQSKMSIPSDGNDHRVHIDDFELPATYEYHTAPKLDPSVFLTAQVAGWEKLNLLSGESNLYFDGTYIGKTYIDVNSTKDTLSFSLGKDKKMQVERLRIDEKSTKKTIGGRQKFEVAYEIKVKNNGGAAIPIVIKDQMPLSVNTDIKVKNGEYEGAVLDEKTGILTWRITLAPSQNKSMKFNYSVDSNPGYVLYVE
ncbi:MAG: DUF4139 domain-containing protein [Flavobacteriia bacterium]